MSHTQLSLNLPTRLSSLCCLQLRFSVLRGCLCLVLGSSYVCATYADKRHKMKMRLLAWLLSTFDCEANLASFQTMSDQISFLRMFPLHKTDMGLAPSQFHRGREVRISPWGNTRNYHYYLLTCPSCIARIRCFRFRAGFLSLRGRSRVHNPAHHCHQYQPIRTKASSCRYCTMNSVSLGRPHRMVSATCSSVRRRSLEVQKSTLDNLHSSMR